MFLGKLWSVSDINCFEADTLIPEAIKKYCCNKHINNKIAHQVQFVLIEYISKKSTLYFNLKRKK
jgi:lipid A disaccharide synthetase